MERSYKSSTLTELLLGALAEEKELMSETTISTLQGRLLEAVAMLRATTNIRRPLFSLPVEILVQVLDEISAPRPVTSQDTGWTLARFWVPSFGDSALLVPASQTCRRLRSIALSRSNWWRYITSTDDTATPMMVPRSGEEPLELVVQGGQGQTNCLRAFYASMTPRMHAAHFINVEYTRMTTFKSFLQLVHPELEALTCCGQDPGNIVWQRRRVVLSHDHFPRLRQVVLDGIMFRVTSPLPLLTHLILSRISLLGLHTRVVLLLNSCPNLESLVISRIYGSDADGEHEPPLLSRLRRIVLDDLASGSMRLYLSLTSLCSEEAALQVSNSDSDVHDYRAFAFEPVLSERMSESVATFVGIGVYPVADWGNEEHTVSVTVASPVSALRITSTTRLIEDSTYGSPGVWLDAVLSDKMRLECVQELWLVRASPFVPNFDGPHLPEIIGALPALQTVVFISVDDPKDMDGAALRPPDLAFLPSVVDNPSFGLPHLKTLRIVQCSNSICDAHFPPRRALETDAELGRRLEFSQLLPALASSAYCYLENLVIELMPRFYVEEEEIEMLGEYFTRVSIVQIYEPPRMPLPQCCVEDDEGPGGSRTWTQTMC